MASNARRLGPPPTRDLSRSAESQPGGGHEHGPVRPPPPGVSRTDPARHPVRLGLTPSPLPVRCPLPTAALRSDVSCGSSGPAPRWRLLTPLASRDWTGTHWNFSPAFCLVLVLLYSSKRIAMVSLPLRPHAVPWSSTPGARATAGSAIRVRPQFFHYGPLSPALPGLGCSLRSVCLHGIHRKP